MMRTPKPWKKAAEKIVFARTLAATRYQPKKIPRLPDLSVA